MAGLRKHFSNKAVGLGDEVELGQVRFTWKSLKSSMNVMFYGNKQVSKL